MSKQWYYEVMGSPVGPISSSDLKAAVLSRRILPETRIRMGDAGKWQTADRVKGLFDGAPAPAAQPQPPINSPAAAVTKPVIAAETGTAEISTLKTEELKIQVAAVTPALGVGTSTTLADDDDDTEYDFFKFVGFENAIGHALNDLLKDYCRIHHVTMTHATRRALAEFLGRKDLGGDPLAPPTPPNEAVGVS